MFLQDHKSLIFTRIGIFSLELMPAYSDTALLPQITPQDTTKCSIKVQNLEPKHLLLVKR